MKQSFDRQKQICASKIMGDQYKRLMVLINAEKQKPHTQYTWTYTNIKTSSIL